MPVRIVECGVPRKDDMIINDNYNYKILTDNKTSSLERVVITNSPDSRKSKTGWVGKTQCNRYPCTVKHSMRTSIQSSVLA